MRVSEFTSGNVARVQRHGAVARGRRLCAVGADAHISPTNCYVNQRGDVGIAPYNALNLYATILTDDQCSSLQINH